MGLAQTVWPRKSVVPAFAASPPKSPSHLLRIGRHVPKNADDDTAGLEGQGPASRGHAPKPRPHVTAARALVRHDSPLGAEADAQSVRCRPGPGGVGLSKIAI